jgi:FkbM family methyltransferase
MVNVSTSNGMKLSCLQRHEVALINAEVQTYFDHGIEICSGNTVLDVGANIGLFALAAWERGGGDVQIHCFEPVAPIFDVLKKNLQRYDTEALRAHPFGLSNQSGSTEFSYYPNAPVLSTAYPDKDADLKEIKLAVLRNLMFMPEAPAALRFLRWLPPFLRAPIVEQVMKRALWFKTVSCDVKTLSQVIRDEAIEHIDFLKIDVEKAELDIFEGIESTDWARITQIVVEVHDIAGRLDTVVRLLRRNGLSQVTVDQPATLNGSSIYTVFAIRT